MLRFLVLSEASIKVLLYEHEMLVSTFFQFCSVLFHCRIWWKRLSAGSFVSPSITIYVLVFLAIQVLCT